MPMDKISKHIFTPIKAIVYAFLIGLLLSDTYEKAEKQDILVEESMEMSEDEADKEKDGDKEEKPLLPPEVFEHLKTAGTEEKKEENSVTGNN